MQAFVKDLWKKTRSFVFKHVLHADDTPHRIALGAAVAMLVAFTPTLGFQTLIAIALAAILRANKAVCVPVVWITNPVTALPVYLGCWELGRALTSSPANVGGEQVERALTQLSEQVDEGILSRLFDAGFWSRLVRMSFELGVELWMGCLLVGLVVGIITYFVTRWGVTEYRQRRRVRIIQRNIRRARMRKARHVSRSGVGRVAASP